MPNLILKMRIPSNKPGDRLKFSGHMISPRLTRCLKLERNVQYTLDSENLWGLYYLAKGKIEVSSKNVHSMQIDQKTTLYYGGGYLSFRSLENSVLYFLPKDNIALIPELKLHLSQ